VEDVVRMRLYGDPDTAIVGVAPRVQPARQRRLS
jgi:hypothetical protein